MSYMSSLISIIVTRSRHNCWLLNLGLAYSLAIGGVINPTDAVLFNTFYKNNVLAQIVPDRTLGTENSVINSQVDIKEILGAQIEGGAIRGTNLFHSLKTFLAESQVVISLGFLVS